MVKFRTKFDSESTAALDKAQRKKGLWICLIISFLAVALGIFIFLYGKTESDVAQGVVLIVGGIVLIPLSVIAVKLEQKKRDKSMAILSNNTVETFSFDYDKFYVEAVKGEQYKSYVEASYTIFYKVVENADCYFLYISKMQCYVVAKKYLVEGNLFELNDILKRYFPNVKTRGNTITYL